MDPASQCFILKDGVESPAKHLIGDSARKALFDPAGHNSFAHRNPVFHTINVSKKSTRVSRSLCTLLNDEVKDTPAVAEPNFVCLPGIDTCTGNRFPGTDAVENFMDYTEDFCMYAFSPGQAERMQKAWHALRAK